MTLFKWGNKVFFRGVVALLALGIASSCFMPSARALSGTSSSDASEIASEQPGTPRPSYDPSKPELLQNKFLYAETAVLMEQHTGKVLYDMQADKQMEPASITKILTLLVALENGNLDDEVVVGREIQTIPWDSSKVPLLEGEKLTLRDLLYGLILRSGNDAAVSIATHVGGSVEHFVDMMNERAKTLGCTGSHFNNPHGYQDKNHYTTAMDMARIARAGMENETFREVVSTERYTFKQNNVRTEDYTIKTKNRFVLKEAGLEYAYPYGTGIKTGYFKAAQHTFVGSASKDGVDLISVVMKTTQNGKWTDAARLMDYGFSIYHNYSLKELYEKAPVYVEVEDASDEDAQQGKLLLNLDASDEALRLGDTDEGIARIKENFASLYRFEETEAIVAPIEEGQRIGTLVFSPEEGREYRYPLIAARAVEEKERGFFDFGKRDRASDAGENEGGVSAGSKFAPFIIVGSIVVLIVATICFSRAIKKGSRKKRHR